MQRANVEGWKAMRDSAISKSIAKAEQRTADAAASNAAKAERARGLAYDRIMRALEQMPEKSGSHSQQMVTDGGKRMTVDYDLLSLVAALEKLEHGSTGAADEAVTIVWGR